jgi:hypothetical protein
MFTCTVASGMLIHAGYYMGFSIIGFMALLKEIKDEGIMQQGYIGVAVTGIICAIYILS